MGPSMTNKSESGNVLFLILIAVALFAALSYAVTQSTRTGGGSADREKSILSGASIIQYPAGLRTSVLRMILSGTDATQLEFNPPSALSNANLSVFSPSGGAALFQLAPSDIMSDGSQGEWFFNYQFGVPELGIDTAVSGNDLIAFLPGVNPSVCEQLNQELNIVVSNCTDPQGAIPELDSTAAAEIEIQMDDTYTMPADQEVLQGIGANCKAFTGQPSGCFFYDDAGTDVYVVYSALLER